MQSREVRKRYLRILDEFIASKKVYQVLNSDDEDSGFDKAQLDLVLSSRGLGDKVVTLQVNDSVHLINRDIKRYTNLLGH